MQKITFLFSKSSISHKDSPPTHAMIYLYGVYGKRRKLEVLTLKPKGADTVFVCVFRGFPWKSAAFPGRSRPPRAGPPCRVRPPGGAAPPREAPAGPGSALPALTGGGSSRRSGSFPPGVQVRRLE